jgi:predicted ATP-grasp superfamily ATP-dependent carboligase
MLITHDFERDMTALSTISQLAALKESDGQSIAVVFGLFETALGVIRSLGPKGIPVVGIDFKSDIGRHSRYVKAIKCPDPLRREKDFLEWVRNVFAGWGVKPVVFITSDDFLIAFSRNREALRDYFIFNLSDHSILQCISDKYCQFQLASKVGINVPATWLINDPSSLDALPNNVRYPAFVKGQDVNLWRAAMGGGMKGILVDSRTSLRETLCDMFQKNVPVILQEVIEGPDTNHFKYCSYTSQDGQILAEFTLRKIRQHPIHFGVGASVESVYEPALMNEGRKLFTEIGFKGIGSAEFKYDDVDGQLKLIEINPRYWQQNYLSTACGMNFPYLNYLDLLNKSPPAVLSFRSGTKWVDRYLDFDSFIKYRRQGDLTYGEWRHSLKGEKVYSDFTWDDPMPALYRIGFGWRLLKAPWALYKKLAR